MFILDDNIKKLATDKGLTVEVDNKGFSVKKNGEQVTVCSTAERLVLFLEMYHGNEPIIKEVSLSVKAKKNIENDKVGQSITNNTIEIREVVVTDIDMPFWSMVYFMIKWVVASIPAAVILSIFIFVLMSVLGGLGLM